LPVRGVERPPESVDRQEGDRRLTGRGTPDDPPGRGPLDVDRKKESDRPNDD